MVQTLAAHLRLLPEREPHAELCLALATVLDNLADPIAAGGLVVRFEVLVLEALGFGLDLSACALTGTAEDLAWVSPKTGRAAARDAGAPWRDRLLPLPAFLTDVGGHLPADRRDVLDGFRLSGHFLQAHVWTPRGLAAPATRDGLIRMLQSAD